MKVAIDMDGTLWAHQELFMAIWRGLNSAKHEVGILTAHIGSKDADLQLVVARIVIFLGLVLTY